MALRVWLPLNGNLENKGLSNLKFNTIGTPTIQPGKIGDNYYFSGTSTYLKSDNTDIGDFVSNYTMSIWIKPDTDAATGWRRVCGRSTHKQYQFDINSSGKLRFWVSKDGQDTEGHRTTIYSTSAFTDGKWHHICGVNDGQKIYLYVDGVLENSADFLGGYSLPSVPIMVGNLGESTSTLCFKGMLADFRLYDEALSLKQIKEISKGLVAHYKLDTPGSINNLKRNTVPWGYNNFSGSGSTCTVVDTETFYNGAKVYRMTYTPNDTSLSSVQTTLHGHGITTSGTVFLANTKYCFWILWKPISHMDTVVGGTASNVGGWTEIPTEKWNNEWNVVGEYRNGSVTTDKTDSIFTSFKCPSATSGTPIIIDFCCPHLVEGYDYILKEFDYIGTNLNYEVDSSGNGYDGIRNGSLTLSDDTARYENSIKFDADTSYIKLPALATSGFSNSFTIIYWAKIANMTNKMAWGFADGNRLNIFPRNSVICCNTGDSGNNPYQNDSGADIGFNQWNDGNWHQYVMVGDGTTNKLYVDGEYQGKAKTYKGIDGTQIYISGWDAGTNYKWTNGSISDFRIYSTALSADDILTMYKNSGIIDNKNNVYAYEFKEE